MIDRDQYRKLKDAVDALASVCDGAEEKDDQGFDGTDTYAGHLYAFLPFDAWPLCVLHRAWNWTKKYHRQLSLMQIDCTSLPEPPQMPDEQRQIALLPGGQGYYVVFPSDASSLVKQFRRIGGLEHNVPMGNTRFFRYRTYHGEGNALLTFAERYHFQLGPGVRECALGGPFEYRVVYESDAFALYFPDRLLNAEVKVIPYRSCSYVGGFHWIIAARPQAVGPLRAFLTRHGFSIPLDTEQRLQQLEREAARANG